MPDRDDIELAIHATIEDFTYDDHVTPAAINRGECEAFAHAVNELLDDELTVLTTANIVGGDAEDQPEPWHVWLTNGEYHFDAEVPEGVDSWAKLPFWRSLKKPDF